MQVMIKEKVNVAAIFRSFRDPGEDTPSGWEHKRIEPRQVRRKSGEVLNVAEVRRSYPKAKGDTVQVHFVIRTAKDRFFHLLYESKKMLWILLYEFEEQMLFDQMDIDVEVTWNGFTEKKNSGR